MGPQLHEGEVITKVGERASKRASDVARRASEADERISAMAGRTSKAAEGEVVERVSRGSEAVGPHEADERIAEAAGRDSKIAGKGKRAQRYLRGPPVRKRENG